MEVKHKNQAKLFRCLELANLYRLGQLDPLFKRFGHIMTPSNLIATGGSVTVFKYPKNNLDYVFKIAPKTIHFFKYFGQNYSAKDFMKYINRLHPFFIPVEEILYEDENVFIYTQRKCKLVTSDRINRKVVVDLFRLIQFMLVNDILLTDLAPHNLGVLDKQLVIFDYHGLQRLTTEGQIKRVDWWRRLVRNVMRFTCGLYCPHKRPEYSLLMENCDAKVVNKMTNDPEIPPPVTVLVRYAMTEQNNVSIERVCELLEKCIKYIKK